MQSQWGTRVAREGLHARERLRSGLAPFFCSGYVEDQSFMYQNAMRRESREENTGCVRSFALECAQGGRIQGFVTQEIGSGARASDCRQDTRGRCRVRSGARIFKSPALRGTL